MMIRLLLLLFVTLAAAGCDKSGGEPAGSTAAETAEVEEGVCDEYREVVRSTCRDSFELGLSVSCHRITTRANAALAGPNEELCRQSLEDLEAERAKKMPTATANDLGEACVVFVKLLDEKCLSRLGSDFPAQCGGALVTVNQADGNTEEACRSMSAILGRI